VPDAGAELASRWHRLALGAVAAVRGVIEDRKPLFAFVLGAYGCGKTYLLSASVLHAHSRRMTAIYATAVDALGAIKRGFRDDTAEGVIGALATVELLALDEVDRVNTTEWTQSTLFQILDRRYREDRVTVMVANVRPAKLPGYLHSRALDARKGGIFEWWDMPDLRQIGSR